MYIDSAGAYSGSKTRGGYKTGRSVHLVDAENLLGDPGITIEMAQRLYRDYSAISGLKPADHVIIAAGPFGALPLFQGWGSSAQRLAKSGPDGADLALLKQVADGGLFARFDRIVVGSGDHAFAPVCTRARNSGLAVTVVARNAKSLSGLIRSSVSDVRFLRPESGLVSCGHGSFTLGV